MSAIVVTGTHLVINSVTTLDDHLTNAELDLKSEAKDKTNMGSAGWREFLGGLKSAQLKLDFLQDFAASEVDATLWSIFGTVVAFELRQTSASRSTTNPGFTGNVLIDQYTPLMGKPGDLQVVSLTLDCTGAIARQTS